MLGIELFAGAGGMGLGARNAGINIVLAVESNVHAASTYLQNHPNTTVVIEDVRSITGFGKIRRKEPVVMFGGPPCQGYSSSNRRTRTQTNPKNWLFQEFFRLVKIVKPDWVVLENVPGLKVLEGGFFLEEICNELHKSGFTPNVKVLNAADFGVPQKRDRLFIVGSTNGVAFEFPFGEFSNKHITISEALSDLPTLENGAYLDNLQYRHSPKSSYAKKMRGNMKTVNQNYLTRNSDIVLKRYRQIPQGGNWKNIPLELIDNYKDVSRCHHNIYRRLSEDHPSPIIANYRKSMFIHPTEDRGLSLREAARIQSFPDNYSFSGPLIHKQQQVGDAVPPMLSEAIFKKILSID